MSSQSQGFLKLFWKYVVSKSFDISSKVSAGLRSKSGDGRAFSVKFLFTVFATFAVIWLLVQSGAYRSGGKDSASAENKVISDVSDSKVSQLRLDNKAHNSSDDSPISREDKPNSGAEKNDKLTLSVVDSNEKTGSNDEAQDGTEKGSEIKTEVEPNNSEVEESKGKTGAISESESGSKPELNSDTEKEPKPDGEKGTASQTESEPEDNADSQVHLETVSKPVTEESSGNEAEQEAESKSKSEFEVATEADKSKSKQSEELPEEETVEDSCLGKQIFIYTLPDVLNRKILMNCSTIMPWFNMCPYFVNHGIGGEIPETPLLVPKEKWYETHQLSLEVYFHKRLKSSYQCLTTNESAADLLYVPYYGALDAAHWHHAPGHGAVSDRDYLPNALAKWLAKLPAFANGNSVRQQAKHFIVLSSSAWDYHRRKDSGWGNVLLTLPALKNVVKLVLERNVWEPNEVAVPYPSQFHPKTLKDLEVWQKRVRWSKRSSQASVILMMSFEPEGLQFLAESCAFADADHQNKKKKGYLCRVVECLEDMCQRPASMMAIFLSSSFCILPPGTGNAKQAVFQALMAGCIPVIFDEFATSLQFPWHLPNNTASFAIQLPMDDIRERRVQIPNLLNTYKGEKAKRMRQVIVDEIIPKLSYAAPKAQDLGFRDAFQVSIDSLLGRAAAHAS